MEGPAVNVAAQIVCAKPVFGGGCLESISRVDIERIGAEIRCGDRQDHHDEQNSDACSHGGITPGKLPETDDPFLSRFTFEVIQRCLVEFPVHG